MTKILLPNDDALEMACDILKNDGLTAIPTETVYGLAANAFSEKAVRKIFEVKNRPPDNPLITHISNMDMLGLLARRIPHIALVLAERFWPGPLTLILPKSKKVPQGTTADLDSVAVRFPCNEIAVKLIEKCAFPLAAPSANLSGSPSPTKAAHVYDDLKGKIPLIIDGGDCLHGVESTVVLPLEGERISILRPGAITQEELSAHAIITNGEFSSNEKPISPGQKYKHYSPNAKVFLVVTDDSQKFKAYCHREYQSGDLILTYGGTPVEQARNLFSKLRECDTAGAKRVFVHSPEKHGIGLAVFNRLQKAAEKTVYLE